MGCADSKPAAASNPASKPDALKFNAADLDDVDQSTHRKKRAAAAAPATPGAATTPPAATTTPAEPAAATPAVAATEPAAVASSDVKVEVTTTSEASNNPPVAAQLYNTRRIMGCATSKDESAPAASSPGEFKPKPETMNRTITSDSTVSESAKDPNSKERQFQLLAAKSKTPNSAEYASLLASPTIKEYLSKGMKDEDIHSLFDIVDADHNGLINYKEYLELLEYIELAVSEKKRVANQNRTLPSPSAAPATSSAPTLVNNPVKAAKAVEPVKPIETTKTVEPVKPIETTKTVEPVKPIDTSNHVEVTISSASISPTSVDSTGIAAPEKAAEGPKRRPPSKRMVHIPTGNDEPPKVVTPIANGPKVVLPFGMAKSPNSVDGKNKKVAETIAEGEEEEEDDDDNDPNRPKQKKGFLINDDIGSTDPSTAKNYYVLDNGKLKYMDHATKQYQVIPLNNRKVQVSSDGVIELISTEEDAASAASTVEAAATSPTGEEGRRNSFTNSTASPRSRISLRVKNDRDVDQWRAAIAEHQQYASSKEESRVTSLRLSSTSRNNSVTSVPTETDSKKH